MAHGKIILIGEHSVVYGKEAIAIPLSNLKVYCKITEIIGECLFESDYFNGFLNNAKNEPFYHAIKKTHSLLDKPLQNLKFKIVSNIPYQRGMGSSAAVSIAIIEAIYNYYGITIDNDTLYELSYECEKIAHYNPSGLDCLLCANNSPYFFTQTFKEKFPFKLNAFLVVCDSGIPGKTKQAVKYVQEHYNQSFIDELGKYTIEMKNAIIKKDVYEVGSIMSKAHEILRRMGVSLPEIDNLVHISNRMSLGAKMTGGGLGGCFIALCNTHNQAKKLQLILNIKGVKKSWIQKI